ncbi:LicD family protein [Novosphingobium sp.]|uniref:LicD family protein n=1 Tax=Novosphingobium sp. TaxID=1874826 RepID=UPI0025F2AA86|nr:LicD family protein [Novosphingobium sp.]MCC6927267.1 LicD family protein [Novosphingobium sp.]
MVAYLDGQPSEKLRRLQQVQQDLAVQLTDYCRKRDLQPFLVAGSALGAWRDGGIIAWDDDIDIGLLREDYDTLIEALANDPIPGVTLQSWRTTPGYPFAFAKLRLDGTRVDESTALGPQFHQGIFIDIFPFDALPRNPLWRKVQYGILLACNLFMLSFSREAAMNATSPLFRRLRLAALAIRPLVPMRALAAMSGWAYRLPPAAKSDTCVSFNMYGIRFAWKTRIARAALVPPQLVPFGSTQLPVPADCHAYLTGIFGDYAKRPPSNSQRPGHIRDVDFGDRADR